MFLTLFLSLVVCAAVSVMLLSAVAFVQKEAFFSSAPKEARDVIQPRPKELFYGARIIGWTLLLFSLFMILGAVAVAIWDGIRSGFTFSQFFLRLLMMFTIYKIYDMICFDYFLLMKFKFFQYYYPEIEPVYQNRKYGFNIKSQLLKLLVIFPAVSALIAWVCTLF
ncbi:MAG: hypothetical protein IJ091_09295 [Oscillospiraceae bacterium]|nr:hypothetical protein [Oscillospiraceae bacterium]